MWTKGTEKINGQTYYYEVKHYEEPSEYGINGGRISKLYISSGDACTANYDRGWDRLPADEATAHIYNKLIWRFN